MLNIQERMKKYNPFGTALADETVETVLDTGIKVFLTKRVQHVFSDGHRVVVHAPGHFHHGSAGKIIDDRSDTRLRVKLDSGHELTAGSEDLIPESLAPVAQEMKILKAAIAAGAVSVHDQAAIESVLEKIETGSYTMDLFGEIEPYGSPFRTLKIFVEKYQASDTSNVLHKRAKSKFSVGQSVIEKGGHKRPGTITGITPGGLLEIKFSPSVSGLYIDDQVESAA